MPPFVYTIRPVGRVWRTVAGPTTPAAPVAQPTPGRLASDRRALGTAPDPRLPGGRLARVVVRIGEHRAYLYDRGGRPIAAFPVRTGKATTPTRPGVKIVVGKNADPTAVSKRLWPASGGRAFGSRLLDLSDFDPLTGQTSRGRHAGQELHGTYATRTIGRDFSHGCVGLRNADIETIYDAVGVGSLVRFDR